MDIHEVFVMKKPDGADLTYFAAAGKFWFIHVRQGIKVSPNAYSFNKSAKSGLLSWSLLGFCSPLPALLLVILAALPFTFWVLPGTEMSLSVLVTGPGVEEALLCPVLCESFLPEEEGWGEEEEEGEALASAPPSTGDTDEEEEEEESPFACMLPFGDEEETEEEEEAEEEVLLSSVLSAPEEDELEEAEGTFAALVFLGFFWLSILSQNFLSAAFLGGPLKAWYTQSCRKITRASTKVAPVNQ